MRNTFTYADSHGYGNGHVHTDSYSYGNGHVHTDSHGYGDGNGYCNLDAHAYRGQTYADAQAAADASSAGAALIGTVKARTREKNLASSQPMGMQSGRAYVYRFCRESEHQLQPVTPCLRNAS